MNINIHRIFNAKANLWEEQQQSNLTHNGEDKEAHTFPKGICSKVNVIAQLEFELTYYDFAVQCFNHYNTRTLPIYTFNVTILKYIVNIYIYIHTHIYDNISCVCVYIYIYIYIATILRVCVCVCIYIYTHTYIYYDNMFHALVIIKQRYEVHTISFQTFFIWALLLIVHTWNSSTLQSNLLRLQCTCCTVPTTSGRPHGSPLLWACQWPSSQPLSSP